jgi:hypothetical protein
LLQVSGYRLIECNLFPALPGRIRPRCCQQLKELFPLSISDRLLILITRNRQTLMPYEDCLAVSLPDYTDPLNGLLHW